MKSENILMDEIVKIRRELKRIKKLKKKTTKHKKKKHRISTKNLTNPVQPHPQPIMITMPPQQIQQPLENLRDISRNYLIPGNNLVANPGNQLAVIPPVAIPPAPPPIARRPQLITSAKKKKRGRMKQAMQYEKPQLQKKSLKELKELINLRLPGQYTDAQLKQINGKNKDQAIDYFLQKIKQNEKPKDDGQYALAPDHPDFRRSLYNDDNFGVDSSQLNNSRFDDNHYDDDDDDDNDNNSFMDASLANAFDDLNNLPPLTFNTPKQVEKKVEKKAAKYDTDDDDFFENVVQKLSNEDDEYYNNFDDINAQGFIDTFYNPMSDQFAQATPDIKYKKSAKKASPIPVRVVQAEVKRGRGRPKKDTK